MRLYKLAPLCGALLLALLACGCDRLKARDHLNKGVQDYRSAQFQPAIMHFKEAVRLDPSLLNARLYLATAYAQQYVPGGDSADNKQIAQQAIDAFQDVLRVDPGNTSALGPRLEEIFKTRNERIIFVKGDPDADFGDVAAVIDAAKGAAIDKIGLITKAIEEGS